MPELPFHSQLVIFFILASVTACVGVPLSGLMWRRLTHALPPVPQFPGSTFPHFFAYFYTVFFVLIFAMGTIAGTRMPADQPMDALNYAVSIVVQIALYIPFLLVYFTLPGRDVPATTIATRLLWLLVGLIVVGSTGPVLDVCGFTGWLMSVTGCPEHQDVVVSLATGSTLEKALVAFMAIFVAPITEECCFRGFVYNIIRHWSTPLLGAVCSAALFSSVHASLAQAIPLFIFGIVQCVAYEKARSLWLPVAIHMIFNTINVLAVLIFMQS